MTDLIRPVRSGEALREEIRSTRPDADSLAIWWLGQSGFVIKSARSLLVIDPYLSDHLTRKYAATARPHVRMTEAPLRGRDLKGASLVLITHKHSDHFDPETIPELMTESAGATPGIVLPKSLLGHARALGLPGSRLIGLDEGESYDDAEAGVTVTAIAAAHEGLDTDEAGHALYLGYVIETGAMRLYHSGDGVLYDGLASRLGGERFDVLFLPINGRDPARGVPGNMSAAEAVDLAIRLRPRYVVPHHYDMFRFNTVPVAQFEAEAARLPAAVRPRILRCGELWEVRR